MKNNIELLKKLIQKIKETPDSIMEEAIDSLSEKLEIEDFLNNLSIEYVVEEENENFNIESESKEWKESLQLAA